VQTGRKTEEDRVEDIRVLSGVSIYFASNLHVSPRVSSLFRAQHSCGTSAFSFPTERISPLSRLSRTPVLSFCVSSPRWTANKRVILSSPAPVTRRAAYSAYSKYTPARKRRRR